MTKATVPTLRAETADMTVLGSLPLLQGEKRADYERFRDAVIAEMKPTDLMEMIWTDDRAAQLAVDLANKLLDRLPGDARVAGFMDGIATGLAKLPEETRASIGSEGQPIQLTVARAVTPEQEGACRTTLAGVFGHPVAIEIFEDGAARRGFSHLRIRWRYEIDAIDFFRKNRRRIHRRAG